MSKGSLRQLLSDAGVEWDQDADVDAHGLLPQWLHPRQSA